MTKHDAPFGLEHAAWPALVLEPSGTIRLVNRAAIDLFGGVLESGSTLLSAIWSNENEHSAEVFLSNWHQAPVPVVHARFVVKGGTTREMAACLCSARKDDSRFLILQILPANPSGASGSAADAMRSTRESKLPVVEAGLAQKQKLDCALQLTRTVALDFNNALTSILGHTSLLLARIEAGNPWRRSLLEVEKAAEKAAEIANDLAAFSRQEKEARPQPASNLNVLLRRSIESFSQQSGARLLWTTNLEPSLFSASFDEAKMNQAIAKIIENAVQAMPADGRVNVETRNVELLEPSRDRNVDLAPGCYVCIEVADSGTGIAPEVLPRVFEPFFTTKTNHRGLGLAWAYGIVTNHGGGIAIHSAPAQGTVVRIYLPASGKKIRDTQVQDKDLVGSQLILVVDDEDLLLTMASTVLSSYGYQVLTANSGEKALEHIARAVAPIDLLITDLVMPQMSGRELIEQVRRVAPSTRIVYSSGYVRPASAPEDEERFLRKPFTARELLLKVKQALA